MKAKLCSIPGCGRPHEARGWCAKHYSRWRKSGAPERPALAERLWGNVEKDANGCWNWRGARYRKGYGRISIDGRQVAAHRTAYRLAHGEIPDGLVVRHRCDNPPCINPDHLEVGTAADNSRDMVERGRSAPNPRALNTRCANGHPFDEVNTYWWNGARYCKACKNEYQVRKRDRQNPGRVRKVVGEERDRLRARAAQLHSEGLTLKEIAADFGRSTELVRDLLGEAGVAPRPRCYRRPPLQKHGE